MSGFSRTVASVALLLLAALPVLAQTAATLRVTVVDPSGAVLVGAKVIVGNETIETDGSGVAIAPRLEAGRYTIRVESPGFETYEVRDVRLRAGENRRDVRLKLARLAETINVGRDPRERASDARSDAFATILGQAEINELPDDPDEMERVLKEMAGPGAMLRINGFHGGRMPSKDQIQQIRFRRNMFAADTHEPGSISIDITTKPGLENWRGSTNGGLRDAALNSRNVFAPVKADERNERYGFSLTGPLWRKHTSLSFSADGRDAYDAKTIVAALPSGLFADSIRKPFTAMNFTARVEHALTKNQMLRVEAQHNHSLSDNLGVGDFDLAERAYRQTADEDVFRVSTSGSIRKSLFNEFRFQWRSTNTGFAAASAAPAVLVLNAFDSGGAQIGGTLGQTEIEAADNLDFAIGRHAFRAGILFEGGRYRNNELQNSTGTFTFASLSAFAAGTPSTFTRNVGNPLVEVSQAQNASYFQDDYRASKSLTLSAGVRQEVQSHIGGLHVAPRGGFTWSPFKSGTTTVRAGGGVFYDWLDAQTYEQAVQLDGAHLAIDAIVNPGYPDPAAGGFASVLPPGRVQFAPNLEQPVLYQSSIGLEQMLPGGIRLNAMFMHVQGDHQLRGVNINAPGANGRRPDPSAGTITQVDSIARSRMDGLAVNVNWAKPERKIFIAANYFLSRSIDETAGPFGLPADNSNLGVERGPSQNDARHRFSSLANAPLPFNFRIGTSLRVQSALPYNITTGRDDNGDTVSSDRPAGVTRNSARGRATVDLGTRLSWAKTFGTRATGGGQGGPQVHIVRGNDADPLGGMSSMGPSDKRYGVELYAQAYNLLNHVNALNFSGVLTSPFFGQPTSAAPARRVEVGVRLTF